MLARILAALALACALVACDGGGSGEECSSAADCGDGLLCVDGLQGKRLCMSACLATERLCGNGAVCLDSPADGRVCWFGGRTPYRRPCESTFGCEPGTVCVPGEGETLCEQACAVGDDLPCRDDVEVCAPVPGAAAEGYCLTVVVVDAGVDGGS